MTTGVQQAFSADDAFWMARAIRLAQGGRFSTTPNPNVGCVLVNSQGKLVGEGYHRKAGEGHAEVHALKMAGEHANGCTAYVTLEPCSHTGKTGPCAQTLINAQVARVLIANIDVNPVVANKGVAMLEAAGIRVQSGLMASAAAALNQGFFKRMQNNMPFVTAKLACSLDGKTALANGKSKWITGGHARADVQIHRAQACAILSGADTVIADDPQLNVRDAGRYQSAFDYRGAQPLRVLIDGKNRLHTDYKIFNDGAAVLVINLRHNAALERSGPQAIEQVQVPEKNGFVCLHAVMALLAQRQINVLWLEAGASLVGAMLDAKLVDELIIYQAPILLGADATDLVAIAKRESLQDALALSPVSSMPVGKDTKMRFVLHQP